MSSAEYVHRKVKVKKVSFQKPLVKSYKIYSSMDKPGDSATIFRGHNSGIFFFFNLFIYFFFKKLISSSTHHPRSAY